MHRHLSDPAAVRSARRPATASSHHAPFEMLSRAGFVARGLIYLIIGVLALELATRPRRQDHEPAGRAEDGRAAAVRALPARPRRRRARRATRSGGSFAPRSATAPKAPTAASTAPRRSAAASSTPAFCAIAVRLLTGSARAAPPATRRRRRAACFGWPAGRWLVLGSPGSCMIGVGVYQFIRGADARSSSTTTRPSEMAPAMKTWITWRRHGRPRRARGRLRPRRRLPRQGRRRLQGAARRSASTARSRRSTTAGTDHGSWESSQRA